MSQSVEAELAALEAEVQVRPALERPAAACRLPALYSRCSCLCSAAQAADEPWVPPLRPPPLAAATAAGV